MEEILSSIRKIIEDGDPAQSAELLNAASKSEPVEESRLQSAEPVTVGPAAIESSAPEIEEFRRELTGPSQSPAEADAGESVVLKEDDQTPVATPDAEEELPSAPEAEEELPAESGMAEIVEDNPTMEAAPAKSQPEPAVPGDDDEMDQDVFPAEIKQRLSTKPIEATPVSSADESGISEPAPVEETASEQPEPQVPDVQPARPIISEVAGRKIAASFEQLSEAFAESRKKSFDEMAEEMLRPMLQEWLDNNLPLLVERLVREEIERVARGEVA